MPQASTNQRLFAGHATFILRLYASANDCSTLITASSAVER
ncbi:hypothetical protein [Roseateles amylovorans]|uniref:Uncharacterized protein n=1 Tax=Roseateles amylovorans TaxID=2978473 RepID=A0ABY6B5R4_9BURK|nr:hypothetical protein [Roseateles amylovorans]UXH78873.1 hypothetical protein N4261_02725 [Roseateles amylovorans]